MEAGDGAARWLQSCNRSFQDFLSGQVDLYLASLHGGSKKPLFAVSCHECRESEDRRRTLRLEKSGPDSANDRLPRQTRDMVGNLSMRRDFAMIS